MSTPESAAAVRRKNIERSYQRAMDIRDSTPTGPNWNEIESAYARAYRKVYRSAGWKGFPEWTRRYLKALRKDAKS